MQAAAAPRLSRPELLSLYRRVLRLARVYPSTRREQVIEAIRLEWRDKAALRDDARIREAHFQAVHGLKHLAKYAKLDPQKAVWSYDFDV